MPKPIASRARGGRLAQGLFRGLFAVLALAMVAACSRSSASEEASSAVESSALAPAVNPTPDSGWSLVWADEFDGDRLDRSRWSPEVSCWGGGNEELQCYTDRPNNIQVADGVLRLIARPETWTGPNLPPERRADADEVRTQAFTSGKIRTRGLAAWRYGRFSARMKLPGGQGTWPAFWMMPSEDHYGPWPLSGEIDIMEAVNLGAPCQACGGEGRESRVQGALHFGSPWPANKFLVQRTTLPGRVNPMDGYHTYTVEWGEGRIDWYVDGLQYFRLTSDDWYTDSPRAAGIATAPFDRPHYLILNLAVGGRLSVQNNARGVDHAAFPAELLVDWVRVYGCETDPDRVIGCMSDN